MFIAGRAIAGIGGAGIVSGSLSVIALVTPTAQRPLFTGLVTSLYAVGTVIAPIIGGAFTTHVTWRWCFYINLPTGAVTIVTLLFFFRPPKSTAIAQQETMIQKNHEAGPDRLYTFRRVNSHVLLSSPVERKRIRLEFSNNHRNAGWFCSFDPDIHRMAGLQRRRRIDPHNPPCGSLYLAKSYLCLPFHGILCHSGLLSP